MFIAEKGEGIVISPEKALTRKGANTLIVVVDTHKSDFTDCPELLIETDRVLVIDHHRKSVDYIDKTVLFYHMPNSSSASEMVAEIAQYIDTKPVLDKFSALALFAGIMLDTRNFILRAGVRTFEAAAYLRRQSVDMSRIMRLFAVPKQVYEAKAQLVNNAETYKGVAISMSDQFSEELQLAIPQAANDLLLLEGVEASVVALLVGDTVRVSARSLGNMNVQVLMEYIGGGGHLSMAGAQLKETTLEQAREKICESIDNYKGKK